MPLHLDYRPKSLDEFCGNKSIKDSIVSVLDRKDKPRAWLFHGPRGCGKCVSGEVLIYTTKGFEEIGGYSQNKRGFSNAKITLKGLEGFVETSHFFEGEDQNCVKITNRLGMELIGTKEHPILVLNKNMELSYKELGLINEGDVLCMLPGFDDRVEPYKINYAPPRKKKGDYSSLNFDPPTYLSDDIGRLMGYLIANGSSNGRVFNFCTSNEKLREDVRSIVTKLGQPYGKVRGLNFSIGGVNFYRFMCYLMDCERFPTARYKVVPKSILQSPISVKLNFIRGLIDCDSHARKGVQLVYYTASAKLAKQVHLMLFGLGIVSTLTPKPFKGHDYWRISINGEFYDKYFELCSSIKYNHVKKKRNPNLNTIPYLKGCLKEDLDSIREKLGVNKAGSFVYQCIRRWFSIGDLWGNSHEATKPWLSRIITNIENNLFDMPEMQRILEKYKPYQTSHIYFSKVVKKEILNKKIPVYDFTIPITHNFIGNGFINHNSTLARVVAKTYGCDERDYQEYDLGNTGGIEEARSIKRTVNYLPLYGPVKFYCLEEIQRSSPAFQEGMLRVTEEGPPHVVFVLCTTDPQKLLPALKSRCFQYEVKPLSSPAMKGLLDNVLIREKVVDFPTKAIDLIVSIARGIPREALILLDSVVDMATDSDIIAALQEIKMTEEVTESLVKLLLKKAPWEEVSRAIKAMKDQDVEKMRMGILGYCNTILLNKGGKQAAILIDLFKEPMWNGGAASFTLACYQAIL